MALRRPSSLPHLCRYFSSLCSSPASPSPSPSWSSSILMRMVVARVAGTPAQHNKELHQNLLLIVLNPCRSLVSPSTPGGRRNFAGSEEDDSEGASGGYGSSDYDEEDKDFTTKEEGYDNQEDFGSKEEDYESKEEEEEAKQVPPKRPSKGSSSQ